MRDWLTARPIAHRGLHDAASGVIENTPSAFRAAIDGGYGIECDLQISADGEAMVHHDDALGRLTDGAGRLDAMTAAALRRIAFKATADRMLTLGELCDLVAGRATLLIELKGRFAGDTRLAARTAEVLAGYTRPGRGDVVRSRPDGGVAKSRPEARARPGRDAARRRRPGHRENVGAALRPAGARRPAAVPGLSRAGPDLRPAADARHVLRWPLLTWTVRSREDRSRAAAYADQMIFEGFRPLRP